MPKKTVQEVQPEADGTLGELPLLPGYMTISQAAAELGISRAAAHQMARSRKLRAWRIRSAGSDPVVVDERQVAELRKKRVRVVSVM